MKIILNLLLWALAFAGPECVHAGHPLWESSLKGVKHAVPLDIESTSVTTWPAGRVRFTYPDIETQFQLMYPIRDAINMWSMFGLPDTFRFVFIDREECFRNRRDCVVIERTDENIELATVIGKYIGPATEALPGSFAMLNMNFEESYDTVIEKAGHQIGHILGLYHEHQNPYFWDLQYGGLGPNSLFTLHCSGLIGFEEAAEGLTIDDIHGEFGICRHRLAALRRNFQTAAHILPMTELNYLPHLDLPTLDDVDWKSIMLYHSKTGAKRGQANNWALYKLNPLYGRVPTRFSSLIERNDVPSVGDVQAVIQLYEAVDTRFEHRYFHDPHSAFFSRFNEMRNFAACDRDIQQPRTATPP